MRTSCAILLVVVAAFAGPMLLAEPPKHQLGHAIPRYAFPNTRSMGLETRDWFAGQALSGCVGRVDPRQAAIEAYRYADAMMEARSKQVRYSKVP